MGTKREWREGTPVRCDMRLQHRGRVVVLAKAGDVGGLVRDRVNAEARQRAIVEELTAGDELLLEPLKAATTKAVVDYLSGVKGAKAEG